MQGSSSDALAVASGTSAPLTLFAAVHKDDVATCKLSGMLPPRLQGSNAYVGFREEAADALERASVISGTPVSKDTHALLKACVAAEALARLTVTPAEVECRFAPMLFQRLAGPRMQQRLVLRRVRPSIAFLGSPTLLAANGSGVDSGFCSSLVRVCVAVRMDANTCGQGERAAPSEWTTILAGSGQGEIALPSEWTTILAGSREGGKFADRLLRSDWSCCASTALRNTIPSPTTNTIITTVIIITITITVITIVIAITITITITAMIHVHDQHHYQHHHHQHHHYHHHHHHPYDMLYMTSLVFDQSCIPPVLYMTCLVYDHSCL